MLREAAVPLRYGLVNLLLVGFAVALAFGGGWIWVALAGSFAAGGALDEIVGDDAGAVRGGWRWFCEANLYATLPILIAITVLLLRLVATPHVAWLSIAGAILGTGYFYALAGVTVAHELTHRTTNAIALQVGRALLAFTLSPTFAVAHVQGHHRNVCTQKDPASARRGEYVLSFALRSSVGQIIEAFVLEAARLRRKSLPVWSWRNRALAPQAYSLMLIGLSAGMAGVAGLAAFVAAAILGKLFHELVNYVQHYGLVRIDGKPIEARHAWDSYRSLSNSLQYNLPRHSHHHRAPNQPFWALQPTAGAPMLPHGYQVCASVALIPSLWRKKMHPLLAEWDREFASPQELALICERGWQISSSDGALAALRITGANP